jgi:UDP-N-acetylglucosamine 3-dehydrogenase
MANDRLHCALLSTAHLHAESYAAVLGRLPQTTLTAVWDDQAERGRAFAQRHQVPFAADLDQLLAADDLDAVIITAENVRHRALCQAACAAGKHVLCEKPLATTAEDAEAMLAAAARAHVTLATAFPMRHNPPARRIWELLQGGGSGAVLAVRATNRGALPPGWFLDPALAGGGAIMDHTVHVADLLRWYLNDEPVEVYAVCNNLLHGQAVEDLACLTITFRSGVVATLDPSWSRLPSFPYESEVTMEIGCEQATLQLDAFGRRFQVYPKQSPHAAWHEWDPDMDTAMVADFARAVREGVPPAASGRDGERALAVVLAAYASVASGQPEPVCPPAAITAA